MVLITSVDLRDFVGASRQISRRTLARLELTRYQAGLLSWGAQSRMDPAETFNPVLDTAISYAASIGVAAFDNMAHVNERVGGLFRVPV